MKTILKSRQNGFAIIEALIAFLLLGIGVAALLYLQGNLMSGSSTSKARAEAMELAKDRTEVLRNYIDKRQFLSALGGVIQDDPVDGVNAKYIVCYNILQKNNEDPPVLSVIGATNPLSIQKVQKLTVTVKWPGVEGDTVTCIAENSKDEKVTLETILYFMSPVIVSAIGPDSNGEGGGLPPLLAPWIAGKGGEDPSTAPIKLSDSDSSDDDITNVDGDTHPPGITIMRYIGEGTLQGRSNVEVIVGNEVKLTSFGGIVHRIQGKIITDRFSVPLDADNDGELSTDELRNYWIDDGGADGTGTADDGIMQEKEVKYWIDGSDGSDPDGIIQEEEFIYWVDANDDDVVDVSEFDPPEATATASSTIEELRVLGSPPSFCLFPICDDSRDTDTDCKVPVNPALDDDDSINDDVDEFGVASYVCYVPGDCTYQDVYASGSLNGCPAAFISPTDDDFEDLNGGWYGRIGNFGIKLNPDDMVCTTDTTKTHLTPSREYVTYRWGCSDETSIDETSCIFNSESWAIIGNEGINTPYSNQTFIIARKNNKPSVYCPIRALSYPGNLVNEQIKRELVGVKKFKADGTPDDTPPAWEKNVVLPENECTTGLSCPP